LCNKLAVAGPPTIHRSPAPSIKFESYDQAPTHAFSDSFHDWNFGIAQLGQDFRYSPAYVLRFEDGELTGRHFVTSRSVRPQAGVLRVLAHEKN